MDFNIPREKKIIETEEFKDFLEDLEYLSNFLRDLAELVSLSGRTISFFSNDKIFTLNTALIESGAQTLQSIKLCCSIGSFSDANTLIRKLRDDLIQYAYFLNIINNRKPFIEETIINVKADNPEDFINSFENLKFNTELTEDEQAVTAWFQSKVSELQRPIRRKLEFENYMKVLKQNLAINHILTEYKLQEYWETLRKRLNDYVHNNGPYYSTYNLVPARDKNLKNTSE